MKIRYMSDLHLEFERYNPHDERYFSVPHQEDDCETILILAGDVGLINRPHTYTHFFLDVGNRFKAVLYVPGNHEYYRGTMGFDITTLKRNLIECNVNVLDDSSIKIGGQLFIGSTLWTDFNHEDPMVMLKASGYMSDYNLIKREGEYGSLVSINSDYILLQHKKSLSFIIDTLENYNDAVVITHHLPSFRSVNVRKWGYHYSNHYYYSDLEYIIERYGPKLWFHGHTHDSFDYSIGKTRVLCNPRGYVGHEINLSFDPNSFVLI